MQLYRIKPIYKSFVWGGDQLIKKYNLDPSLEKIGTIYLAIAIENDLDNEVIGTDMTLSQFYKQHPEVFGCSEKIFPVRLTITCNDSYQSYQIHPDDEYALKHEGTKGKVSGSVSLFAQDDEKRKMLFGNKCKTLQEFKDKVKNEDWENLFEVIEKPANAFLHTPAGLIHGGKGNGAINATFGTNGDITYRFFDFHRNDPKRPLHLNQCFDIVNIPEVDYSAPVCPKPEIIDDLKVYHYYDKPKEYVAKRIKVNGKGSFTYPHFAFYACVDGKGKIGDQNIAAGETILVPCNYGPLEFEGNMDLIFLSYHQ